MTRAIINPIRFGSVCSGIEAASAAWLPLGWQCAFTSEIEPFPRAVLAHHYPDVPCHGDFTTIKADDYGPIDLLCGGTPCQSFSIAGLRGGLDDDRGNLALEFLRLADRKRPRWLVWENVPGVLSSNERRDFGAILGGLVELGYGFAYRVLDAQYFGVPQRRRRVFVVGHSGKLWQRAAAVLFERHSLSGHFAPSREAGERVAGCLRSGPASGGKSHGKLNGSDRMELVTHHTSGAGFWKEGFGTLRAREQDSHENLVTHTLRGEGFDASKDGTGRGTPLVALGVGVNGSDIGFALRAHGSHSGDKGDGSINTTMVATLMRQREGCDGGGKGPLLSHDQSLTLAANANDQVLFQPTVLAHGQGNAERVSDGSPSLTCNHEAPIGFLPSSNGVSVRRLTPRECERLQGFKDDFTQIPWRGKPAGQCPDGPRYKALGNSMAVPVMRWIGERIQQVENINLTEA